MYEAERPVKAEYAGDKPKHPQNLFNQIDFNDTVLKSVFNSQTSDVMDQFGTLKLEDPSQQQDFWSLMGKEKIAGDAADKTIQEIKDAAKLSGTDRDVALNKIVQEIDDLSKRPDMDMHLFYVSFQMDLTQHGDPDAVAAISTLDPLYRIQGAIEKYFMPDQEKSNSIHNTVDERVGEVMLAAQNSTGPATFDAVAANIEKDLSTLTRDEQELYLFSLSYQVHAVPQLKDRLEDINSNKGGFIWFGTFSVPPTDADQPSPYQFTLPPDFSGPPPESPPPAQTSPLDQQASPL